MYTNLLNTNQVGNYSPRKVFRASEYNSNPLVKDQQRSVNVKLAKENEILNSSKIPKSIETSVKLNPNAPVAKSGKSFKAIFEILKENPLAFDNEIEKLKNSLKESPNSSGEEREVANYFITLNSDSYSASRSDMHLLKQKKEVLDKYKMHEFRDPGVLLNVFA